MSIGIEVVALGTATCIALSSFIATEVSRSIGAFAFTKWRMMVAFFVMAIIATLMGAWSDLNIHAIIRLVLSGIVGIVIGDVAIYAAMAKIGPRKTSVIFSTNAGISVVLGFAVYGQLLTWPQLVGVIFIVVGIIVTILFRDRDSSHGVWDGSNSQIRGGVLLAITAAVCQAGGAILAAPALVSGVSPIAATAVRVGASALALSVLGVLPVKAFKQAHPLNKVLGIKIVLSALIGMCVGMTLLMLALSGGKIGVAMTYASLTPIMTLPLLWLLSKSRPSAYAWGGAFLAGAGAGVIFLGK